MRFGHAPRFNTGSSTWPLALSWEEKMRPFKGVPKGSLLTKFGLFGVKGVELFKASPFLLNTNTGVQWLQRYGRDHSNGDFSCDVLVVDGGREPGGDPGSDS